MSRTLRVGLAGATSVLVALLAGAGAQAKTFRVHTCTLYDQGSKVAGADDRTTLFASGWQLG